MTPEQILQAGFTRIRPQFIEALAACLDHLEELRDAIDGASGAIGVLQKIGAGAHETVGSAATLGFVDLGRLLARTEQMIANHIASNGAAPRLASVVGSIDDTLGEMALIVTAAGASTSKRARDERVPPRASRSA